MSSPISRLIGITGGIGSGKSVLSRILRLKGYQVYDCDSRAKILMDTDILLQERIRRDIAEHAVTADGKIDRKILADIIFADEYRRVLLNHIVHTAVRDDILHFRSTFSNNDILFVEAAVLAESGLAEICDEIWVVTAGEDQRRIERVIRRNGWSADSIKARINAQKLEQELLNQYKNKIFTILNDDITCVLSQVNHRLCLM